MRLNSNLKTYDRIRNYNNFPNINFASAALGYWVISKLLNYKFFSESYGFIVIMLLGFAICSLPIFICGLMWG